MRGSLVLIGGAEDRKKDKHVLMRAVGINNAQNICVLPCASSYPATLGEDYVNAFKQIGVKNVSLLDIRTTLQANEPEYILRLQQSDMIFFTGGDQVKLVRILHHTKCFEVIKDKFENKGLTIAGTSAGAASASNPMLYDGDYHGFHKGSVKHGEGFGWLSNITIDTHFVVRSRTSRLVQFLISGLSRKGIGLAEDTGIIVSPDGIAEIIGSSIISFISTKEMKHSNYDNISNNQLIAVDGINVGFLPAGYKFDLNKWQAIPRLKHEKIKKKIKFYKKQMN